jgi:hypothetical protein
MSMNRLIPLPPTSGLRRRFGRCPGWKEPGAAGRESDGPAAEDDRTDPSEDAAAEGREGGAPARGPWLVRIGKPEITHPTRWAGQHDPVPQVPVPHPE